MPTIHLLRHGQTAWNVERRFLGRTDLGLDDVGRAQVAGLPGVFPAVTRVWSSPLCRALDTARAVTDAQGLAPPAVDDELVEMDMGKLEGMDGPTAYASYREELLQFREDPTVVILPGGETMLQTAARMLRPWTRILAATGDEPVAIVSHQMALSALLCTVTGEGLSAYRRYTQRNTAWTTLTVDGSGAVTVIARDQAPHLDPSEPAPPARRR